MATWFVSRHPGAIAWAAAQGLSVDCLVPHFEVAQVQSGDTVIGTLPVHLAAQVCARGAHFFNLSMDIPAHWRGLELSAAQLRSCNARLEAFHVRALASLGEDASAQTTTPTQGHRPAVRPTQHA